MKILRFIGMALLAIVLCMNFYSCSEDSVDSIVPENPTEYESISGKYEITDVSSPYESIELLESGDYIVIKRSFDYNAKSLKNINFLSDALSRATTSNVIYGTFTQLEDGSLDLKGFGIVKLIGDDNQEITSISIKPDGEDEMVFSAKKCEDVGNDEQTKALCHTWKMVKSREVHTFDGEVEADNTYIPDEIVAKEVTFSKSGTFVVYNPGENTSSVFYWKWENQEELRVCYSKNNTWNGDEDSFTVELSENKLVIREYEEVFEDLLRTYEKTTEFVKKNALDDSDNDEINLPTDKSPAERVFGKQLLSEIVGIEQSKLIPEFEGTEYEEWFEKEKYTKQLYKHDFTYQNGCLTEILSVDENSNDEKVVFEYNYLTSDKSASEPNVRYTIYKNGRQSSIYEVKLNEQGFAEFIDEVNGIDLLPASRTVCQYDEDGHLIFYYKRGSETDITWTDGDITKISGQTFTYYDTPNSNNLMLWEDIYGMSDKNLMYLYWAGLLGYPTKHLVAISPIDYRDTSLEWDSNKLTYNLFGTDFSFIERTVSFSFATK